MTYLQFSGQAANSQMKKMRKILEVLIIVIIIVIIFFFEGVQNFLNLQSVFNQFV